MSDSSSNAVPVLGRADLEAALGELAQQDHARPARQAGQEIGAQRGDDEQRAQTERARLRKQEPELMQHDCGFPWKLNYRSAARPSMRDAPLQLSYRRAHDSK